MEFIGTAWALLPPVVAIVLALITKETFSSLFVGIVVGALLLAGFDPAGTLDNIIINNVGTEADPVEVGLISAITGSAGIFVFLVILGVIVALVNAAGAADAFHRWAAKHVKTRMGAQLATMALGILLFIDDYFNCLTVGAVMRPVTDAQRVSRAKLSYIIDATAAPICMIAPVSSWAAAVADTAADLDTGISGIQLFIQAIPFNFYSLLTILFVVVLCIMGFEYGPMAAEEIKALQTGDLGALGQAEHHEAKKSSMADMVLPVIALIVSCIIGMLYVGGFWDQSGETYMDVVAAFGNTDAGPALSWGSLIALAFTFIYYWIRRVIGFKESMDCLVAGFKAMVPAILILTFALTLKSLTGALGAATFVATMMDGAAASLYAMLPAIIFLVGLGLAFSTGTSWGTFGILIPIVTAIFPVESPLLVIGISACLAGAVCGDHCSPISDTTIMASAGADVDHITHVSTQLPYALTVAGISFVCFVIAGFVQNPVICLVIGLVLTVGVLFVLKKTIGVNPEKEAGVDLAAAADQAA